MRLGIYALILALLLTGCATASFEEHARELVAPDVVVSSTEQLTKAATEVETQEVPQLTEMMKDYCVMRDQSRTLKGEKPQCAVRR